MSGKSSRRTFLKTAAATTAAITLGTGGAVHAAREYKISLAGWSLHRTIGEGEGKVPMLEMPRIAREELGIDAIELVSRMLVPFDKSFEEQKPYLDQLAANAKEHDVEILLIMVDGEGNIGGQTERQREEAVTNHKKWIDIANYLGCHSIRMNWGGAPRNVMEDPEALSAFIDRSVAGFTALCDYGDTKDINVIIENHGGPSSYPEPMKRLMEAVDHPRFGTLPDFGNFPEEVDIYEAVDVLMNYAKAVSAKCYDFDAETGMETKLDYPRLIENVVDKHGYNGYIGIEYEGSRLSEIEGIAACKALLEKLKA
jgi:L-ribulose-5-phosphate 3-epimerase